MRVWCCDGRLVPTCADLFPHADGLRVCAGAGMMAA